MQNCLIVLAITLIGAFYLATIRSSDDWGGDYAQYIRHAINIADGVKYDQNGYIYNPYAVSWPKTYPPVFPLLLVPVYKIYGLNTWAMKVEISLLFLIFLFVLTFLVRHRISFASLIGLLIVFSLNPFNLNLKNEVVSDMPFLLFAYLAMFLIQKFYTRENFKAGLYNAIFLGAVIYLSYGTRSLGILLVPSLLAYELVLRRRISAYTFMTIATFLFLAVLQGIFFHSDSDYLKIILHKNAYSVALAVGKNLHSFLSVWSNGDNPKIQAALFFSLLFLAISGFMAQVRRGARITEFFFLIYGASILIWPSTEGLRYFLPMLPLYIFYIFCGTEFWAGKPVGPAFHVMRTVFFIGLLGAVVFNYGLFYRHWDYRALEDGPYKKESVGFFEFVREKIPQDAVLIFRKPPILALFTGRKASTYHCPANQEELWRYMHSINAHYLVYAKPLPDRQYLAEFIERYQNHLKIVFVNNDFRVFEVVN
jgi:hypothetical protein